MTIEIAIFFIVFGGAMIVVLWILLWQFAIKYGKNFQHISSNQAERQHVRKERLNMEVVLTDDEKRVMRRRMICMGSVAAVVLVIIVGFTAWDYWRFVVNGERIQGTITDIVHHTTTTARRHRRSTYTYTLVADIKGVRITDTYSPGSYSGYDIGDVVDIYAVSSGTRYDLAIATVEQKKPFSTGIISGLGALAVGYAMFAQYQWIRSGRAKIRNLPKSLRAARLAELSR